jgi:hypothetical protein
MARLTKRDAERLLADYDADPVGALTVAVRIATGRPDAGWAELVTSVTDDPQRRAALAARDLGALDALARELNELRGLDPADPLSGRPAATRTPARGRATP